MALNYEEGKEIIETEKKSTAKAGVCFQNRFNNNNKKAKEILENGALGKIKGIKGIVTWHRGKDYYLKDDWKGYYETEGGGVLINQAIHTLDLIQWFGGPVSSVRGNVDTRVLGDVIEVEDTADATLFFEAGFNSIFYATNAFSSNSPIEIEIDCEKGSIRLFDDQLLISKDGDTDSFRENNDSNYKAYWGYGHQRLINGFYQDIRSSTQNNTIGPEEGIKTLELIKAINSSSKNRKEYYLNGDDKK